MSKNKSYIEKKDSFGIQLFGKVSWRRHNLIQRIIEGFGFKRKNENDFRNIWEEPFSGNFKIFLYLMFF